MDLANIMHTNAVNSNQTSLSAVKRANTISNSLI
jgi:hypothetical protein